MYVNYFTHCITKINADCFDINGFHFNFSSQYPAIRQIIENLEVSD